MALRTFAKFAISLALCCNLGRAGINWKAVWLDKPSNPVSLKMGEAQAYTVMGLSGGDTQSDLTQSEYLRVIALDPSIVEVDTVKQAVHRGIGR